MRRTYRGEIEPKLSFYQELSLVIANALPKQQRRKTSKEPNDSLTDS